MALRRTTVPILRDGATSRAIQQSVDSLAGSLQGTPAESQVFTVTVNPFSRITKAHKLGRKYVDVSIKARATALATTVASGDKGTVVTFSNPSGAAETFTFVVY